jgi:hypothetical protein
MMRRCVLAEPIGYERSGSRQRPDVKRVRLPKAKDTAFAPRELEKRAVVGRLRSNRPRRVSSETARSLRRNAVGESVRMKRGVITQTEPGTILLGSLRHTAFFTCGEVFPRIVTSDG